MREREVVRESVPVREAPVVEREVIVDDRPRRGGGGGALVAIVGVILIAILAWFLLQALGILGEAAENGEVNAPDVNIEAEG